MQIVHKSLFIRFCQFFKCGIECLTRVPLCQDVTLTGDEDNLQDVMAVTFGRIEEFDGAKEEWSQYEERLGHFFAANGVESAEKKRSISLSVVGAVTYKLLCSLVGPAKPGEKPTKNSTSS